MKKDIKNIEVKDHIEVKPISDEQKQEIIKHLEESKGIFPCDGKVEITSLNTLMSPKEFIESGNKFSKSMSLCDLMQEYADYVIGFNIEANKESVKDLDSHLSDMEKALGFDGK